MLDCYILTEWHLLFEMGKKVMEWDVDGVPYASVRVNCRVERVWPGVN